MYVGGEGGPELGRGFTTAVLGEALALWGWGVGWGSTPPPGDFDASNSILILVDRMTSYISAGELYVRFIIIHKSLHNFLSEFGV